LKKTHPYAQEAQAKDHRQIGTVHSKSTRKRKPIPVIAIPKLHSRSGIIRSESQPATGESKASANGVGATSSPARNGSRPSAS